MQQSQFQVLEIQLLKELSIFALCVLTFLLRISLFLAKTLAFISCLQPTAPGIYPSQDTRVVSLKEKLWIMSHPVFKCLSPALQRPSLLALYTLDSQICFPHLISCLPSLSSSHTGPRAALRLGRNELFMALF